VVGLALIGVLWASAAQALPWDTILPANRGMDWSKSGADPAIMDAVRPQCVTAECNTLEIPTASIPRLAGASVPNTETLAASWYLPAKPSWWPTPWGEPKWPPIGPDVVGGNHQYNSVGNGIGGHVDKIPAQLCYENAAVDSSYPFAITNVDRGLLAFDATTCYIASSAVPPVAPTNVIVSQIRLRPAPTDLHFVGR